MPRMGKTEEDWNRLKWGFLKAVLSNSFSKLISAVRNFKNNAQETYVCLESLTLSFTCNFFAYFKFHSDWGRVIGKIKQNDLDCHDTAPKLTLATLKVNARRVQYYNVPWRWRGIVSPLRFAAPSRNPGAMYFPVLDAADGSAVPAAAPKNRTTANLDSKQTKSKMESSSH